MKSCRIFFSWPPRFVMGSAGFFLNPKPENFVVRSKIEKTNISIAAKTLLEQ
jgi:hypothetical protein